MPTHIGLGVALLVKQLFPAQPDDNFAGFVLIKAVFAQLAFHFLLVALLVGAEGGYFVDGFAGRVCFLFLVGLIHGLGN